MNDGPSSPWRFRTRAIHVGQESDPQTGAVVPPIHPATTYEQPGAGQWGQFDYSRSGNPTRAALERTLAELEGASGALAFSSGMAATHCATMLLDAGDHLIAGRDIYGGSYRLFHQVLNRHGVETTLIDLQDVDELARVVRPTSRMLWLESIGNPLLSVPDLPRWIEAAHQHGLLVAVDNTFATPALLRPLELGADIVMHSATKFLGGHSDCLAGVLAVRDRQLYDRLYFLQNATGAVLSPFDSFLLSRGIKTLELRILEQSRSALKIAQFLEVHPQVSRVLFPGLPSHPDHHCARELLAGGFGAIITFEIAGGFDVAKRFVKATRLFRLAVSLGAVESLIEHPASMSHASYDAKDRQKAGITDGLIRLSVGLEDVHDLIADLEQAFRDATSQS